MLLLYAFVSTFADMLYVYSIPTFLEEGKKLSPVQVGWFTMLPLLGGALGGSSPGCSMTCCCTAPAGVDGRGAAWFCTGKFLAACLLLLSLQVEDGRLVMVVLLACKFFADWSLPTQWGTITDIAGRRAATVFGLVNTIGAIRRLRRQSRPGQTEGLHLAGPVLGWPLLTWLLPSPGCSSTVPAG